ncbi:hypothetical protein EX30DRAFT_389025 [Ascodesmis nigricans]|uniref:Uncharacterized protein n=1 Tax=Ascodesmis nigricans TaxID=341454 RepID=A0A4S2MQY0_9PEZI|nr:hypothetical protein EX30DRAFT_389025 [Ascodesmis nigricans]
MLSITILFVFFRQPQGQLPSSISYPPATRIPHLSAASQVSSYNHEYSSSVPWTFFHQDRVESTPVWSPVLVNLGSPPRSSKSPPPHPPPPPNLVQPNSSSCCDSLTQRPNLFSATLISAFGRSFGRAGRHRGTAPVPNATAVSP